MPRKQVGLKLDEADVERWDAWALAHGYTRTTLIEAALNAFTGHSASQVAQELPTEESEAAKPQPASQGKDAVESQTAEEKQEVRAKLPRPRPGIRNAWVCYKCQPPRRVFLPYGETRIPECPHGRMEKQENKPYFGQSTK